MGSVAHHVNQRGCARPRCTPHESAVGVSARATSASRREVRACRACPHQKSSAGSSPVRAIEAPRIAIVRKQPARMAWTFLPVGRGGVAFPGVRGPAAGRSDRGKCRSKGVGARQAFAAPRTTWRLSCPLLLRLMTVTFHADFRGPVPASVLGGEEETNPFARIRPRSRPHGPNQSTAVLAALLARGQEAIPRPPAFYP